ncbi:MAG: hypothetical protein IT186_21190 [Acidobacteria bacterium]|nr:hypothetical protein [Acidobacteriota bacterium]MCG3193802.1 hypothetical protein [Thermoanaerobaculia bacterium]
MRHLVVDKPTLRHAAATALGQAFFTLIDRLKYVHVPVDGRTLSYQAGLTRSYDLLPAHGWVVGMSRIHARELAAGNNTNRDKVGVASFPDYLLFGEVVSYEQGYLSFCTKIDDIETGVIKHISNVSGQCPDLPRFHRLLYQGLAELRVRFGKAKSW